MADSWTENKVAALEERVAALEAKLESKATAPAVKPKTSK